jgi:hypothetical protein
MYYVVLYNIMGMYHSPQSPSLLTSRRISSWIGPSSNTNPNIPSYEKNSSTPTKSGYVSFTYAHHSLLTPLQAYYFAIVTNALIRFSWIFYIPILGPNPNVCGGILGVLEALRRFQWNFFRLENEHLGNADQYRVTREVPLPYAVDPAELSDDGGDEDDPVRSKVLQKSPLRLSTMRRSPRVGRTSQG